MDNQLFSYLLLVLSISNTVLTLRPTFDGLLGLVVPIPVGSRFSLPSAVQS